MTISPIRTSEALREMMMPPRTLQAERAHLSCSRRASALAAVVRCGTLADGVVVVLSSAAQRATTSNNGRCSSYQPTIPQPRARQAERRDRAEACSHESTRVLRHGHPCQRTQASPAGDKNGSVGSGRAGGDDEPPKGLSQSPLRAISAQRSPSRFEHAIPASTVLGD